MPEQNEAKQFQPSQATRNFLEKKYNIIIPDDMMTELNEKIAETFNEYLKLKISAPISPELMHFYIETYPKDMEDFAMGLLTVSKIAECIGKFITSQFPKEVAKVKAEKKTETAPTK